tara:strand:+ start:382 stop:543 length:162 start_codon:yes stop_codon:yes gene_type:complete
MEVDIDIECSNCNTTYSMTYDSDDIRADEPAFHCAFCGILMEPYYFDDYDNEN